MTLKWFTLIVSAACLCCVPPTVHDFEGAGPDDPMGGWSFVERDGDAAGRWEITADNDNQVLRQSDRTMESGRMTLAIVDEFTARNVRLSVRMKVTDGVTEQSGGIVWRYADPENYMLARLDLMDQRICLYRVFRGNRIMFGMAPNLPLDRDRWYTLRVEHTDNSIKVYLDDELQLLRWHRHVIAAGQAGLWVKGDSVVEFDDFQMTDRGDHHACCHRRHHGHDDEIGDEIGDDVGIETVD